MTVNKRIRLSICLVIWLLSFVNGYARNDSLLIRAHFTNRPLEEVLTHLTETYQLTFSYEPSALEDIKITAHIDARPLDEAAALIFGASGLDFMILNQKQIMIRPREESSVSFKKEKQIANPKTLVLEGYIRDAQNGMHYLMQILAFQIQSMELLVRTMGILHLEFPIQHKMSNSPLVM